MNKEIAVFGPEELTTTEKSLLDLYRSADDGKKKAALLALKNKKNKKKIISMVSRMMRDDEKDSRAISNQLLGFTYFYSVSLYILLLNFYFWQWRTDIKPEKIFNKRSNNTVEK